MKKTWVISLALNLILLAVIVYFVARPPKSPPIARQLATLKDPEASSKPLFNWRQVESSDYRKYIANLRNIGCPEETIRDIITTDVNKLYAARRAELLNLKHPSRDWWQPKERAKSPDKTAQMTRELENEKRGVLRELLGIELDDEAELSALGQRDATWRLDSVPAAKRDSVRAVVEEFDALQKSLLDVTEEPTDWPALRAAYEKREAALAKLLTPSELEAFKLRNDEVAETLRSHLAAFHPAEAEFRDLFRALKKHADTFAYTNPNDETVAQQSRASLERSNEEIKAALGEQRYAEYQRAQSYEFQNLHWLTQQFELPEESATKIFDANQSARNRLARLQAADGLTDEQRAAGLRELQEELQDTIKTTLGDRAYRYFQRWENSHWLQN